mgnify:CR=1 FL=1
MSFKGISPGELYERYAVEGGQWNLEMDLLVAGEIAERVAESSNEAQTNAKRAVARRDQARAHRKQHSNNSNNFFRRSPFGGIDH